MGAFALGGVATDKFAVATQNLIDMIRFKSDDWAPCGGTEATLPVILMIVDPCYKGW